MTALSADDLFFTVRNTEEQHSIWPVSQVIPHGWSSVYGPAARQECLARISEIWTDIRPRSVRTAAAD